MKLSHIHIKNLRSLRDCEFELGSFISLVGANGAGKSTVLFALNVFFRHLDAPTDVSDLDAEDFYNRDTGEPIEITVTFSELSEEAQGVFSDYYRQDRLVVSAIASFDQALGKAKVKQYGRRLVMARFAEFFRMLNDGESAASLRAVYAQLRSEYLGLPAATSKEQMKASLREYENDHLSLCELVPSEDQFYGFTKGANRLADFVHWVYVPAVKDASKEIVEGKSTALGQILSRTVRTKINFADGLQIIKDEAAVKYKEVLAQHQSALDNLSHSLTDRLNKWAHPGVKARLSWESSAANSVRVDEPLAKLFASEHSFEGELARFGHGLQRSYLLALLQELSLVDTTKQPTLILGVEEPELYQHPPQARHLASVLQSLSEGNAQILVSTHSPHFVSGRYFESVRLVRRRYADGTSSVHYCTFKRVCERISQVTKKEEPGETAEVARLQQSLQPHVNEMFFSPKVVFVEGLEDMAYIVSSMEYLGLAGDFRRLGGNIIPIQCKSMIRDPLIIAQSLGIPSFVVFDGDSDLGASKPKSGHKTDNETLLRLLGGNEQTPFPAETIWSNCFVQWPRNIRDSLRDECGPDLWDGEYAAVHKELGNPEGTFRKNGTYISLHIGRLHKIGKMPSSLRKLCAKIIEFCSED